jgi:hypothetical protein
MLQSCDNAAPKWRAAVAYAGALNRYYKQLAIATIVPVVLTQGSTDFRTLDMPKVLNYSAKVHRMRRKVDCIPPRCHPERMRGTSHKLKAFPAAQDSQSFECEILHSVQDDNARRALDLNDKPGATV